MWSTPMRMNEEITLQTIDGKLHKFNAYSPNFRSTLAVDITEVERTLQISHPRFYLNVSKDEELKLEYIRNGEFKKGNCYLVKGKQKETRMKKEEGNKTGLCYHHSMFNHKHNDHDGHPENPTRLRMIVKYLQDEKMFEECHSVPCRKANFEELRLCHKEKYIRSLSCEENSEQEEDEGEEDEKEKEEEKESEEEVDDDTETSQKKEEKEGEEEEEKIDESDEYKSYIAALYSCGSVLELVDRVVSGELDNGFALCRPPGHHATSDETMGFCYLGNVAIASKYALKKYPDKIKKILIIDWDVHFGNGTNDLRIDDENILFISIHADIYPGTGDINNIGSIGNTINICFGHDYNDNDMLETFHQIVIPVSKSFEPDLVLISAGFDALKLDLLGDCELTTDVFSHLTKLAMEITRDKKSSVVMALEGGYEPHQMKKAVFNCIKTLRGYEELPVLMCHEIGKVNPEAKKVIREVKKLHMERWTCLDLGDLEDSEEEGEEEELVIEMKWN